MRVVFQVVQNRAPTKREQYLEVLEQARALMAGEPDRVANAANLSALIYWTLPDLNWVGFYFFDGRELVVGPFQGKPACVRIAPGKGVCGTAAASRETVVVRDVEQFPGHIACDVASRSEIVVPLVASDGHLLGVLDVDSPKLERFDHEDQAGMEALARAWLEAAAA